MLSREEIEASVILPHFHAVQDVFMEHEVEPGFRLKLLAKIKFVVDKKIHNTPRHFAATREDGLLMLFAPGIVDLPVEALVAIITHEFGHAVDFLYPARWISSPDGPAEASWIREEDLLTKQFNKWKKLWRDRSRDQIEWTADGIAAAVTGQKITYCGDCMIQCFGGGIERPEGLR